MPKINQYIIPVDNKNDEILIEIAKEMELSDSTGVMDLIAILIEAEIDRYNHEKEVRLNKLRKMMNDCMEQLKEVRDEFNIQQELYNNMSEEEKRIMVALKTATNQKEFKEICNDSEN